MRRDSNKPEILIGVDLGQTCTGVAYNVLSHGSDIIRWIQKWPGKANANENKVPTILVYPHGQDKPSSWGFRSETQAEQNPDNGSVREWFKTQLDPVNLSRYQARLSDYHVSHDEVRQWFRDYLGLLYESIKNKMTAELPHGDWSAARVEFMFSVPTTWNPHVVEDFKRIICEAGFDRHAANHTVAISLTEPEAAAVHTSTAAAGIFKPNDVLVVCDAGGGTTDLSTLRVVNANDPDQSSDNISLKKLQQLDVVEGENIGSAAIDYKFERLVKSRLEAASASIPLDINIEEAAWEITKGIEYQNTKCEHGAEDDAPTFSLSIPALRYRRDYDNAAFGIADGEMRFERSDLRTLFDEQIDKLFKLIDRQLVNMHRKLPSTQINHLVLSGGLGQSVYVQQRLRERYGTSANSTTRHPNALQMQVRVAPDPQLAVCKGLVADRLRKLRTNESVMGWRCCRASYGVTCRELYDKRNPHHAHRPTEKDKYDGCIYVPHCIHWFVKKGEPVSTDAPIIHEFCRKMTPGNGNRVFPTKVVMSYNDLERLPAGVNEDVTPLCDIASDLTGADETRFKERNKRFWKSGERFLEIFYEIRVLIGPADLTFELWFDDHKLSKDSSIKVDWTPATPPPAPSSLSTLPVRSATTRILEEKIPVMSAFERKELAPVPQGSKRRTSQMLKRMLSSTPAELPAPVGLNSNAR
ncbi:hypothetical protein K431DRAFT_129934 [Polychaeton citri CBS 116435]|uniref:Actin-like ATPase domain-containing protein n=1 Tax=Polychaeton citri CBS 116435 TaxID=1314669 RepID=A0A9P4Q0W9_9PEZI|nr:hypothetical protein K431DRAFT_129934 [Polychaeton citri CBS 116435]